MNSELTSKLMSHFADIEFIGEGMTSKVFKALDRKTNTTVAVKALNPHLKTDKISLERFKREIQITRAIQHPNVISIYDLAVSSDPYYLVMEFIDGVSLKDYIKLNSPIPIHTAISIITQLLAALSLCHAKNVIHRDLKPQNIMITADGNVKILDFGIARMTALSDLTQTGTSLGSPEYMAPELFATNAYEPRSDLYAVGVVAFELLSGEIPFQGDTLAVLFHKHLNDPIPALSNYRKDIPPWLEQVVAKLLAKKPYQRYQSANDAGIDLKIRRVISNAIPVPPTRPCFACGEQTPADACVCFICGEDGSSRYREGNYYITCDTQQDPERMRDFFRDYIGKDIVCKGKRGTVLASGVDEIFVNNFKNAAQRYGIHVVSRGTLFRNIGRAASLLILLPMAFFIISGTVGAIAGAFADSSSITQIAFKVMFSLVLVVGFLRVKDFSFTFFRKPVLNSGDFENGKFSELAWFNSISPLLKLKRNEDMQKLISQTLGRLLIFEKHAKNSSNSVKVQMRKLIVTMLPVANYLSRIELTLQNDALAKLMREHSLKTRNSQDTSDLERTMQALFNEEENYAVLVNRLTRAMALFNRLMGMALVLDQKIEETQLDTLRDRLSELRQEVEVWGRVKGDMACLPGRTL